MRKNTTTAPTNSAPLEIDSLWGRAEEGSGISRTVVGLVKTRTNYPALVGTSKSTAYLGCVRSPAGVALVVATACDGA